MAGVSGAPESHPAPRLHCAVWLYSSSFLSTEKEKGRGCALSASNNPGVLCFLGLEYPGVKRYHIPSLNSPLQSREPRAQLLGHCILAPGSTEILQINLKCSSVPPLARSYATRLKSDVGRSPSQKNLNPKSNASLVCPASEELGRQPPLTTPSQGTRFSPGKMLMKRKTESLSKNKTNTNRICPK